MKKLHVDDFIERSIKRAKLGNRLFDITWELTYQCNLQCLHCCYSPELREDNKKELPLPALFSIIDQLVEVGCFSISLTGGEIFFRPDISEILTRLIQNPLKIDILTNGTLITESIADLLAKLKPRVNIQISLYGMDEETYGAVTGIPQGFNKCMRGINYLKEKNVPASISMTIVRQNFHQFHEIREFAKKEGLPFKYDYEIYPRIDRNREPLRWRIPLSWSESLRIEEGYGKREDICSMTNQQQGFPSDKLFYCHAGTISMAVNPYGKANICEDLPFPAYDIVKDGVDITWQKIVSYVKNIRPGNDYKCHDCSVGDFCTWCPAVGWKEKNNLNSCVPYYRDLALMEKRLMEQCPSPPL